MMDIERKRSCTYANKRNILVGTTTLLTVLFVADIIFQGEVYKRLPTAWQNKLSEWIGR